MPMDFGYREICACVAMGVLIHNRGYKTALASSPVDAEKIAEASFAIADAMRAHNEWMPQGRDVVDLE